MPIDILTTPFTFERLDDIYIVGTGPSGLPFHEDIPMERCIGVNKIICGDNIIPRYWLCSAPALLKEDWFRELTPRLIKFHVKLPFCSPIFLHGPLTEAYPDVPYFFKSGPSLWGTNDPPGCLPGYLRSGAGVVGRAIQLAYWKKAKRVILVGVDMKGRGYFDGTKNKTKQSIMPDGTWTELPHMNRLIKWCKQHGMDVVSLSETLLDVERI